MHHFGATFRTSNTMRYFVLSTTTTFISPCIILTLRNEDPQLKRRICFSYQKLRARVIRFESKAILPVTYHGLNVGYREADLIVYGANKDEIVVELKATTYAPRAQERAQLRSYLRSHRTSRGLLVNFRQPTETVPCPKNVDWEEICLEEDDLIINKGIVSSTHSEKETKTDDGEQNETKGKGR